MSLFLFILEIMVIFQTGLSFFKLSFGDVIILICDFFMKCIMAQMVQSVFIELCILATHN